MKRQRSRWWFEPSEKREKKMLVIFVLIIINKYCHGSIWIKRTRAAEAKARTTVEKRILMVDEFELLCV